MLSYEWADKLLKKIKLEYKKFLSELFDKKECCYSNVSMVKEKNLAVVKIPGRLVVCGKTKLLDQRVSASGLHQGHHETHVKQYLIRAGMKTFQNLKKIQH